MCLKNKNISRQAVTTSIRMKDWSHFFIVQEAKQTFIYLLDLHIVELLGHTNETAPFLVVCHLKTLGNGGAMSNGAGLEIYCQIDLANCTR